MLQNRRTVYLVVEQHLAAHTGGVGHEPMLPHTHSRPCEFNEKDKPIETKSSCIKKHSSSKVLQDKAVRPPRRTRNGLQRNNANKLAPAGVCFCRRWVGRRHTSTRLVMRGAIRWHRQTNRKHTDQPIDTERDRAVT